MIYILNKIVAIEIILLIMIFIYFDVFLFKELLKVHDKILYKLKKLSIKM